MQKLLVLLPSNRGFLSLCELAMNLSSHQIIVIWKERSSSDMPVNLILIFFQVHQNYLILSVNLRSVLICYTTLLPPEGQEELNLVLVVLLGIISFFFH